MRSWWVRLAIPFALTLVGAFVAGGLAWREAERARATARILMRDYASFIADKFVALSASRYRALVGFSSPTATGQSAFALLRSYAKARESGGSVELPLPNSLVVDYFFDFDAESGSLAFSGRTPAA